ncbi:hypothetical protein [Roseateles saccharophilus]|uniref:Uncharacterized protein n=1 Tax=Roseateles saccharophilus TaxID=304 RepID=A0A4R3V798_ROSSA|nr:hypothetical protein [Roseateles saccharophilus]MDG0831649.1 hypothetical protein [Roseateles saccharophilus]TCV00936.1 hypothetical protein EV671_100765 [Roseateles saccharophilus]
MRRRSFALAALLPALGRAEETAMGSHGMAVFGGREGLYASHLPMFHAPHDSQLVFRFHIADAAADRALRDTLAREPRLWTFDPEAFDLLRLAPGHVKPLREFKARFFEGHFERGGKPQAGEQQVVVDEVLLFRRLRAAPREAATGSYRLIGKGDEWFAFKRIDRRPDFDHILRLDSPQVRGEVAVAIQGLSRPSGAVQTAFKARGLTEIYFETEDLR